MNSDHWNSATTYDGFMGRWSRELAPLYVGWLGLPPKRTWLEIGCGTGSLTRAICELANPASLTACDPSPAFVEYSRISLNDDRVNFIVASADDFPLRTEGYDAIASLLALNFFPSPASALERMRSAVRPNGVISACVWDYAGEMQFLRYFWNAAKKLDAAGQQMDEGARFPMCNPESLTALFENAGLENVECEALDIVTSFRDFSDYWTPFLGGTGPAPSFLASLGPSEREALQVDLQKSIPTDAGGAISLRARAWAVRGRRSG